MFKQLCMLLFVSYVFPIGCAEPDNTQELLSRMPTILREICKENIDNENTGSVKQLLICMDSHASSKEKLQKMDVARIIPHFEQKSCVEYNNCLRQEIYSHVGWLLVTGGNIKRKNDFMFISPKTTERVANEFCEHVFFVKQLSEHPYDKKEEVNNWLVPTQKFPARFAELFIPVMKQGCDSYPWLFDAWQHSSRLIRISYVLSNPEKSFLITWAPRERSHYIDMIPELMEYIVACAHFQTNPPFSRDTKKKDWESIPMWTKQFIEAFSK